MTEQKLLEKIEQLERENALFKLNGPVGLYYELNRIVNETVELSREKTLKSMLTLDPKEDKSFERMQALIKNAKEHVLDMQEIKEKCGLTGDKTKDEKSVPFIEQVANRRDS